jgi:hypothetical protein
MSDAMLRAAVIAEDVYWTDGKQLCVHKTVGEVNAPVVPTLVHAFFWARLSDVTGPINLKIDVTDPRGAVIWTTGGQRMGAPKQPGQDCDCILPLGGILPSGVPSLAIQDYGPHRVEVYVNGESLGGASLLVKKPEGSK